MAKSTQLEPEPALRSGFPSNVGEASGSTGINGTDGMGATEVAGGIGAEEVTAGVEGTGDMYRAENVELIRGGVVIGIGVVGMEAELMGCVDECEGNGFWFCFECIAVLLRLL